MQRVAPIDTRAKARLILNQRLQENSSRLLHWQRNPLDYFVERLGIRRETIDWSLLPEYQNHEWDGTQNPFMEILNGLVDSKYIGVESATSTGKTHIGACILLWFLECFPNSLVITSAPKEAQLKLHIWKEVGRLYPKFNKGIKTSLSLRMIPNEDRWLAVGFVAGVKADEDSSTKAQGFHAEHMLIILEETPGIPAEIITAFENTSTAPHNLILAFGNPDHQLDNLHKFCKTDGVKHIRISAYDHPNVVLDKAEFIPGAQSTIGLQRMRAKYFDESNPMYRSRARGISPEQSIDSLIKLEWCYSAVDVERKGNHKGLGVDVSNSEFGDEACIARGEGNELTEIETFVCPDSNQLGHKVVREMKDGNISEEYVAVDGIGVGAGTVNAMYEDGITDTGINIQSASSPVSTLDDEAERFNNLRSQMYWALRQDLRTSDLKLPKNEKLFAELVTPKFTDLNGKISVESKKEIKKRLGRSPNMADAVAYWNWRRKQREYQIIFKQH